jgi:hypothetical protein
MQEEMRKEQDKLRDNATIYDILKIEHKDVKRLFKQIIDEERFQENIYTQIKTALMLHMDGEVYVTRWRKHPNVLVLKEGTGRSSIVESQFIIKKIKLVAKHKKSKHHGCKNRC